MADGVSIVMCGVGGQGTILASRLIASAAMRKGIHVRSAETIGMAQRGGSVFSYLRLGEGAASPRTGFGKADLIIGFEPAEALRMLPYLKKGGYMVVSSKPVMPVTASIGASPYPLDEIMGYLHDHVENLIVVDTKRAERELGTSRCLNVVLLGAACRSGAAFLSQSEIVQAVRERLPERLHELNERALYLNDV